MFISPLKNNPSKDVMLSENNDHGSLLLNSYFPLFTSIKSNVLPSTLFSDSIASFDGANFIGDISIQANSSIISPHEPRVEFLIDGKSYYFDRITQITPLHINGINISTSYADIDGYSGFYSRISLNNSTEIRLYGDPIILSLLNDEGTAKSHRSTSVKGF